MLRTLLCSFLMLALTGFALADKDTKDTKDKDKKGQQATITKVDAKNHTVTVKMKDKDGKETEKTFKLTEDIRYLDSTGKAAAIDVFRSGDEVLVVEAEGQLKEVRASNGQQSDQSFLKQADQINLAEIQLGKLAKEDASSNAIKQFGEKIGSDHAKMNQELRELAKKKNWNLSDKLDAKHQEMADQLSKMKGADFDRAFSKDMVAGHEKALEKFEAEAKNGQDSDLKAWAEKWVPTLRDHLKMARDAVKDVKQ